MLALNSAKEFFWLTLYCSIATVLFMFAVSTCTPNSAKYSSTCNSFLALNCCLAFSAAASVKAAWDIALYFIAFDCCCASNSFTSIDNKACAFDIAPLVLASAFCLSIVATCKAFCRAACCLLSKFLICIFAYDPASLAAMEIPDSITDWVKAAAAILDAPSPLCCIIALTFLAAGDAQAGRGSPSSIPESKELNW